MLIVSSKRGRELERGGYCERARGRGREGDNNKVHLAWPGLVGSLGKSLVEYNFVNLDKYMVMVTGSPLGTEQIVDPESTWQNDLM